MQNAELIRKVCFLDIEGEVYTDVVVAIKSISPDGFFSDKYRVKVKVTDSNGKTVWNKTMKPAPLYIYSDRQILIYSGKRANRYEKGIIREKEGVYN